MSNNNMIQGPNFEEMDIGQLRQYASHLGVALAKTDTKKDIIEKLNAKQRDKAIPEIARPGTQVKPGYAKIRIMEDPTPGASTTPVFMNANGYVCTIPRGIEVIVPIRVVRTLNDAIVKRKKQNFNIDPVTGRERMTEQEMMVPSYPFQILEMVPGPEQLTSLEASKLKTIGPRRRYRDMFGRWPKPVDLQRAIEQGLISLQSDEELSEGVARIVADKGNI